MIDITAVPEFPYNDMAYLAENAIFVPDVLSFNDYYPFGMLIPGRHDESKKYRYGFQGQEKDDEIKGEGNSLNYTFRMHACPADEGSGNPRVGRFFAVDPLTPKYPHNSPYTFSENRVIDGVELDGAEFRVIKEQIPGTVEYDINVVFDESIKFGVIRTTVSNIKAMGGMVVILKNVLHLHLT